MPLKKKKKKKKHDWTLNKRDLMKLFTIDFEIEFRVKMTKSNYNPSYSGHSFIDKDRQTIFEWCDLKKKVDQSNLADLDANSLKNFQSQRNFQTILKHIL